MKKLFAFAIVILGFSAASFAQPFTNSANANATATIFTALTIEKKLDLVFGKLGAKTTPTIAIVSTSGSRSGSSADLIADPTVKAAEFQVKGDGGSAFTVTFPVGDTELTSGVLTPMKILAGGFTAKIDGAANSTSGTIAALGTTVLKVGATLQVGANQDKGDYTGSFSVTVNYN